MNPEFRSDLITSEMLGSKYCQLVVPFVYYSAILGKEITVPVDFICDYESVPLLKASSKRGGVIHDYLCRKNSDPVVTKQVAASVYHEAQVCRDKLLGGTRFKRFTRMLRRNIKTVVVRIAWGYFHRLPVMATLEDVKA